MTAIPINDRDSITDAAVRWNLAWSNTPDLEFLVNELPPEQRWTSPLDYDGPWHKIVHIHTCPACAGTRIVQPRHRGVHAREGQECDLCSDGTGIAGNFYIRRVEPCVAFLFESSHGGGALGRTLTTTEGERVRTNGGWSSNAAKINQLRTLDDRYKAILPHPLVEAVYVRGDWADTGMAGLAWDLPFAEKVVAEFLPGVELVCVDMGTDLMASTDQAAVVTAGIQSAERGALYLPYPVGVLDRIQNHDPDLTPRGKPVEESKLYQTTSEEVRRQAARSTRAWSR